VLVLFSTKALSSTMDLSAFLELSTLTDYFIGQLGGAI